mgnify:FL=1
MSAIWVVVADSSRARIFSAEKPASPLVEIQTLAHPQARLHEGDLVSDKAGRDRNPGATSHDMGNESDTKREEAIRFANQVCSTLEAGRTSGQFEKLYVIAAPSFLGILRKHQSNALGKLVTAEVSKNLAGHHPSEIRKNLPEYL